jgi:hypothetical protein
MTLGQNTLMDLLFDNDHDHQRRSALQVIRWQWSLRYTSEDILPADDAE